MVSADARVLLRPSQAYQALASEPAPGTLWIALRRPLLLACMLGGLVSLGTTGVLTLRIVVPATLYWGYVPAAETLALVAVVWTRRRRVPFSRAIDAFFAGHALWTLYVVVICWLLASMPPDRVWFWLTTWCLAGLAGVIGWSAYIDFCFYRRFYGTTGRAAIRDLLVQRAIGWMIVFGVFAAEGVTPWHVIQELAAALEEVFRP
jgi:hypothetical protein